MARMPFEFDFPRGNDAAQGYWEAASVIGKQAFVVGPASPWVSFHLHEDMPGPDAQVQDADSTVHPAAPQKAGTSMS